jgi:hypothetical protein
MGIMGSSGGLRSRPELILVRRIGGADDWRFDMSGGFDIDAEAPRLGHYRVSYPRPVAEVIARPTPGTSSTSGSATRRGTATRWATVNDTAIRPSSFRRPPRSPRQRRVCPGIGTSELSARARERRFSLGRRSRVRLGIFDPAGREVARLMDEECAGRYAAVWDGPVGRANVAAGVYFARLEARREPG